MLRARAAGAEASAQNERRDRRSDEPQIAAQYYLDALLARGRARAAVVTVNGALVAGAGPAGFDLDSLGRLGAICSKGESPREVMLARMEEREDVFAHRLTCGRGLCLTTLGQRVRSVRLVERDLGRIFGIA